MRFRNICRNLSQSMNCPASLIRHSRVVFFLKGNNKGDKYVEPQMNLRPESQAARENDIIEDQQRPAKVAHGFEAGGDEAISAISLGVKEDILTRVDGQLLDERTAFSTRSNVGREMGLERQRVGFFRSRWRAGRGLLGNLRNLTRGQESAVRYRTSEIYGQDQSRVARNMVLANGVSTSLTGAQWGQVQIQMTALGMPLPAAIPPYTAQEIQLANATREQLGDLENNLNFLAAPPPGPLYPDRAGTPPANDFQRLIRFRDDEGLHRDKMFSTTINDPVRLQRFLDNIETAHPNIYRRLEEILKPNELFGLENNARAQRLVLYLMGRYRSGGPVSLLAELINIRENLAPVDEKVEEGVEPSLELRRLEQVKELTKTVESTYRELRKEYAKGPGIGSSLYDRRTQLHNMVPGARGDEARAALVKSIDKLDDTKNELRTKVNELESTYRDTAIELTNLLHSASAIPGLTPPPPTNHPLINLINFNAAGFPGLNNTNENQLFRGRTTFSAVAADPAPARGAVDDPSSFQEHISEADGFTPSQMSRMTKEIESQYHPRLKKRKKVTNFQLLALLYEGDFARAGYTNSLDRKAKAFSSAMADVEQAELMIPIHRQANQELAERFGGRTLGSNRLDRFIKGMISRSSIIQWITGRKVLRMRQVVDYVAGLDKETAMFIGIEDDIKIEELRDLIENNGGISDEALFEFTNRLIEVFKSFEILSTEGKIEFDDRDALEMEKLLENCLTLRRESRTRLHKTELQESKEIIRDQEWLNIMESNRTAAREADKTIYDRVTDKLAKWKGWFDREILNEEVGDKLVTARAVVEEEGMSSKEAKKFYASQGLATAITLFGSAYARKEWLDKGKGAARTARKYGGRMGGGLWNKLIRPVGKYTIAKPIEYLAVRPTKWAAKGVGKLAVGTGRGVAKIVTFPFALAGSLLGIKSTAK